MAPLRVALIANPASGGGLDRAPLERADIDRIMGTTQLPRLRVAAATAIDPPESRDKTES